MTLYEEAREEYKCCQERFSAAKTPLEILTLFAQRLDRFITSWNSLNLEWTDANHHKFAIQIATFGLYFAEVLLQAEEEKKS